MYLKLVIVSLCLKFAFAFPDGAPTAACQTMVPQHGSTLPFDLPVDIRVSTTSVNAGGLVTVSLVSIPGTVFGDFFYRGFMVQARDDTGRVLGFFEQGPGVRHADCPMLYPSSTVTHTQHNDKNTITINWRAPTGLGAPINVRYFVTIVMNVGLYWVNQTSQIVTVLNH